MSKDTIQFEMEVGKEFSDLMRKQKAEEELFKEYAMKLYKESPEFYKKITTEDF